MGEGAERAIVLCADDYGLNDGVNSAIVELAVMGRISATSCMTNAPGWAQAAALSPLVGRIGIGLHLTLTWGRPLGSMPKLAPNGLFPGLSEIVRWTLLRRLDQVEIEAEIERQLGAFSDALGRPPDFIDGHQHVHVLPVVREALLAVLVRRCLAHRLWLRDPSDRIGSIIARRVAAPKALFVAALARGFRREAAAAGLAVNQGFSGFSSFLPGSHLDADMDRFLLALGPHHVVMCHPGCAEIDATDPVAPARLGEFEFLRSSRFAQLMRMRNLRLESCPL